MGNGEKYMSKKNSAMLAGAFIVGIVINKSTGDANSMAENFFSGFLATGQFSPSSASPNLDVN